MRLDIGKAPAADEWVMRLARHPKSTPSVVLENSRESGVSGRMSRDVVAVTGFLNGFTAVCRGDFLVRSS
jgi:hypothetical protein